MYIPAVKKTFTYYNDTKDVTDTSVFYIYLYLLIYKADHFVCLNTLIVETTGPILMIILVLDSYRGKPIGFRTLRYHQ